MFLAETCNDFRPLAEAAVDVVTYETGHAG